MGNDEQYMLRAIELAKRGEGLTRPNPPVGAVLVLEDQVIAEGWHHKAGEAHAERDCLNKLPPIAPSLKRATLYVTLEPCSTHGRTPPCTELILEKGIGRVVVSVMDLNPRHAGRGLAVLSEAGVELLTGVCEKAGRELIAPFEKFITTGMPFVTLKLASTLDGRIADSSGDSKWITGAEAREKVQAMRRRVDAIMVGAGTVRADNPSLLPRPAEGRIPWRVVIGSNIPPAAKILTDEAINQTRIFAVRGRSSIKGRSSDFSKYLNPRTDPSLGPCVRIKSLEEGLRILAEQYDVMHVLCEGGGTLAAGLVEEGLVDEFAFFVAPKLIGADGLPNFGKIGGLIGNVTNLKFTSVEQIGDDVLIKAKPV